MKRIVDIEQCLRELGYAVVSIKGTSMWPLWKEGKNQIQLAAKDKKQCKRGDVILYRREDGTLVLHRIIKRGASDTFWACGDHQWKVEEAVREEQILDVAQGFFKNG